MATRTLVESGDGYTVEGVPSPPVTEFDKLLTSINADREFIVNSYPPPVVVPQAEVSVVVGDTLQIFTASMVQSPAPYALPVALSMDVGTFYKRFLEYTPASAVVPRFRARVRVRDHAANLIGDEEYIVRVVAAASEPAAPTTILFIGDSITFAGGNGGFVEELYRRLTQAGGSPAGLEYGNIALVGEKPCTSYPTQKFVAHGAWRWSDYVGTTRATNATELDGTGYGKDGTDIGSYWSHNGSSTWRIQSVDPATNKVTMHNYVEPCPAILDSGSFVHVSGATHTGTMAFASHTAMTKASNFWTDGTFSFADWATKYSLSAPTLVYIYLGWAEMAYYATDYEDIADAMEAFLAQLHADWPSTQVRVLGLCPPPNNGYEFDDFYAMLKSINETNAAYETAINAYTLGTNLVTNPGFETWSGALPTGWTCAADPSPVTKDTTDPHGGSNALRIEPAVAEAWYNMPKSANISVTAGKEYRLTGWSKGDGTNSAKLYIYDANNFGFVLAPWDGGSQGAWDCGNATTEWRQFVIHFNIPAGCSTINLFLDCDRVSGAYCYFDDLDVQEAWLRFVPLAPRFDAENSYLTADVAVNTRSATTEARGTDGIHPGTTGHYLMADAIYADWHRGPRE